MIVVLLFAFMKICNDMFIVILITEMYWIFINYDYSPLANMMCRYVLTIESDNSCFS